jgi:transcriptional regulator with XRE-family HTH domain
VITQEEIARAVFRDDIAKAIVGGADLESQLESKQRLVSRIERGRRPIGVTELESLISAYPAFLDFILPQDKPSESGLVPLRRYFAKKQQDFLRKHSGVYEMWFTNGESIPMYSSRELQPTWSENIVAGVNYHILWDLYRIGAGAEGKIALQQFRDHARRVCLELKSIQERRNAKPKRNAEQCTAERNAGGSYAAIDVYGYYFGFGRNRRSALAERLMCMGVMRF